MIHVMEWACTRLIREAVPDAGPTVGFEVCIKHVGGAPEGTPLTVTATLREAIDGRKFRCDVEVRDGERTIGVGTHERRAAAARLAPGLSEDLRRDGGVEQRRSKGEPLEAHDAKAGSRDGGVSAAGCTTAPHRAPPDAGGVQRAL